MVLTRAQLASGSPRKPPTPRRKQKERKKLCNDSSSDDEEPLQMTDIKKSLAVHLEPISEEDETVAITPDSGKKTKKGWSARTKHVEPRFQKTPLKIPFTIEEEYADDDSNESNDSGKDVGKKKVKPPKLDVASSSQTRSDPKDEKKDFGMDKGDRTITSMVGNLGSGVDAYPLDMTNDGKVENTNDGIQSSSPCQIPVDTRILNKNMTAGKLKNRFYFPPPKTLVPPTVIKTSIDVGVDVPDLYIDVKGTKEGKKKMDKLFAEATVNKKDSRVKGSVITPDFERNFAAPGEKSAKQKWKERKTERESNAGKEWFNLKPPEMTPEVQRDLKILQMRSVLDPKRFYKHNDRKVLPKYFQVGRVMDNAADFYSSRVPKKARKANLTEELLADAEFQRYQKRKYNEIQMQKKTRFVKRSKAERSKAKRQKFSSKSEDDG